MQALINYLIEPIFWNWLILAGILLILEIFGTAMFFMFWGIAAIVIATLTAIFPELSITAQLVSFSILSLCSVVIWWKYVASRWQKNNLDVANKLNNRAKNLVGRQFQLQKPIINGYGRLQIDDTMWTVQGEDMEVGTTVVVDDIDSLILKIKRVS